MNRETKTGKIDLRTVKKHKLYPVLNEYFTEIFIEQPNTESVYLPAIETLQDDLNARYQVIYPIDDLLLAMQAYSEWDENDGGFTIKRIDFYLPTN